MPGLSMYYSLSGISTHERAIILGDEARCEDTCYVNTALHNESNSIITCLAYDGYPIRILDTDDYRIYFEGCIYGESDSSVKNIATLLAESVGEYAQANSHGRIRSMLLGIDGEFIAVIRHKRTAVFYIVTDLLGRLPLYYSQDDRSIVISRRMNVVAKVHERREYDRLAIAQYLLFGYSLGTSTIVKGVHRLGPGAVVTIDPRSMRIDMEYINTFCFSEKLHSGKSLKANAAELADLLSAASANRIKSQQHNIVSLSGGLDSRTIAACIPSSGLPVTAVTMTGQHGTLQADASIAEEISRVLGIEWKLFRLQSPSGEDALKLLNIKTGLNYLAMSFIMPFLTQLKGIYGTKMNYVTGDGGDKVLVDLRPRSSITTMKGLLDYIVSRNQIFSMNAVCQMTGIDERDIVGGIEEHVSSYPEKDWNGKYVHFLLYGRAFRWLFEGEDRNRYFFWHLAPFYGVHLFRYAMNCPDDQKMSHKLYREMLFRLAPTVVDIRNANWGFPITSRKYYRMSLLQQVRDLIPGEVKKYIKRVNQVGVPQWYMDCVSKQIAGCSAVQKHLLPSEVLRQLRRGSKREAQTLLTVTSTIELLTEGHSTLSQYSDCLI